MMELYKESVHKATKEQLCEMTCQGIDRNLLLPWILDVHFGEASG